MRVTDDGVRAALHDDAYRYAFRRSLSTRLASMSALEAVRSLDTAPSAVLPGSGGRLAVAEDASGTTPAELTVPSAGDDGRVAVLTAARAALERYLPPTLPPRVEDEPDLQAALASLHPGERELLLLHHWDGLTAEEAARASGQDAGQLSVVEAACAGRAVTGDVTAEPAAGSAALQPAGSPPEAPPEAPAGKVAGKVAASRRGPAVESLVAALHAADPARTLTGSDFALSRRRLPTADPPVVGEPEAVSASDLTDDAPTPPPTGPPTTPLRRRAQSIVGAICLFALVAVLAGVLIPRTTSGPAGEAARLFGLADVVAVVSASSVEPTLVDGEMRILQSAPVVQIVKGEAEEEVLTIDVTGRSTLERPYSRNFFPPNQLLFLVGDDDVLSPLEGEGSVLILIDRRSPEATTVAGDPAPLPDELRDAIDALPEEELILGTSGQASGALDPESIVGILPADGRDSQNLPENLLGTFRAGFEGDRACVLFEFNGRSVLIRWPEGFTAYRREPPQSFADGDPSVDRRILTVLNERGYPYVDENRSTPFIRGGATGGRGVCGGQELEEWDIAIVPGSTLLFY